MQFERLDQFVANKKGITRSQAQKLIEEGRVRVNGELPKKTGLALKPEDHVSIKESVAKSSLQGVEGKLDILHEDAELLVINKDPGLIVHPSPSSKESKSVVQLALHHLKSLPESKDLSRPGLVHRLDKDTSGVLLIAKTLPMQEKLMHAFAQRQVKKIYLALVKGKPDSNEGSIITSVKRDSRQRQRMAIHAQGKKAVSHYRVLQNFKGFSLLEVEIETGRTHQIRLHLASIGHPVLGDKVYGDSTLNKNFMQKFGLKRQFLHAKELSVFGKSYQAPLKEDLETVLTKLSS